MTVAIGYAQAVITPSLDRPVFLAGFGRDRRAESVHDDLYVRALAVENAGRLLIIIACDLISLHRAQCSRDSAARRGAAARHAYPCRLHPHSPWSGYAGLLGAG